MIEKKQSGLDIDVNTLLAHDEKVIRAIAKLRGDNSFDIPESRPHADDDLTPVDELSGSLSYIQMEINTTYASSELEAARKRLYNHVDELIAAAKSTAPHLAERYTKLKNPDKLIGF